MLCRSKIFLAIETETQKRKSNMLSKIYTPQELRRKLFTEHSLCTWCIVRSIFISTYYVPKMCGYSSELIQLLLLDDRTRCFWIPSHCCWYSLLCQFEFSQDGIVKSMEFSLLCQLELDFSGVLNNLSSLPCLSWHSLVNNAWNKWPSLPPRILESQGSRLPKTELVHIWYT